MNDNETCQSCGMTIDDGTYCQYCTDKDGNLQNFEERLERMAQWLQRQESIASQEEARQKALAAMAEMPAWRDHPQLKAMRA
jgi:wobble nucleotide-excising tRNase